MILDPIYSRLIKETPKAMLKRIRTSFTMALANIRSRLFHAFLSVLGTLIIVAIIKAVAKIPFQAAFTMNTMLIIAVVAVVIGLIFGTYPATKAAQLYPVEAIRRE